MLFDISRSAPLSSRSCTIFELAPRPRTLAMRTAVCNYVCVPVCYACMCMYVFNYVCMYVIMYVCMYVRVCYVSAGMWFELISSMAVHLSSISPLRVEKLPYCDCVRSGLKNYLITNTILPDIINNNDLN